LNAVGSSLTRSNKAIALIGLGSVGVEADRLDDYSDLDFFGVVERRLQERVSRQSRLTQFDLSDRLLLPQ
jgi:hypothetical protein